MLSAMGNPSLKQPHPSQPAPAAEAANGILGRVPGPFVSDGIGQLPKAREGEQPQRDAVVEVPGLGLVRITYRLNWYKHRKNVFWHWRAVRADRA
jgi:hypothetical protein